MERTQCPFANERINKTGYIHTMECSLACDGSFYVNLTGHKAPTLNTVVVKVFPDEIITWIVRLRKVDRSPQRE